MFPSPQRLPGGDKVAQVERFFTSGTLCETTLSQETYSSSVCSGFAPDSLFIESVSKKFRPNVGTCLWHVFLTYHRAGNMAKGMSLRYGVIVFGDLTQAQHQIGDTKLLIFFHTTPKKSTSLQVYESTGCRNFENSKLSSLLLLHIADWRG